MSCWRHIDNFIQKVLNKRALNPNVDRRHEVPTAKVGRERYAIKTRLFELSLEKLCPCVHREYGGRDFV